MSRDIGSGKLPFARQPGTCRISFEDLFPGLLAKSATCPEKLYGHS